MGDKKTISSSIILSRIDLYFWWFVIFYMSYLILIHYLIFGETLITVNSVISMFTKTVGNGVSKNGMRWNELPYGFGNYKNYHQ